MISNSQTKLISSLAQKKHRDSSGLFVAEGPKVISELLEEGVKLKWLFSTQNFIGEEENHFLVSETGLKKISFLKTPNSSLAVFEMPSQREIEDSGLMVALDAVRDPGNLGTIIRLCDWFGVQQLLCSLDTVDCYNPKVVQATMGSLARVSIQYVDLATILQKSELPVYGGFMEGGNLYSEKLSSEGIIVVGNEANGISDSIAKLITKKITIPRYGKVQRTESLNVATATAILLSEFRRTIGM